MGYFNKLKSYYSSLNDADRFFVGVIGFLWLFIIVFCIGMYLACKEGDKWAKIEAEKVYNEGARAQSLGISEEANPYQGCKGCTFWAKKWLEGYMDGKESNSLEK